VSPPNYIEEGKMIDKKWLLPKKKKGLLESLKPPKII
jgi:hypothetical protein